MVIRVSDPAKYRTREEVDKVRTTHDPIEMARQRILERKYAPEDQLKKTEAEVRDRINRAAQICHQRSEPDAASCSPIYTAE